MHTPDGETSLSDFMTFLIRAFAVLFLVTIHSGLVTGCGGDSPSEPRVVTSDPQENAQTSGPGSGQSSILPEPSLRSNAIVAPRYVPPRLDTIEEASAAVDGLLDQMEVAYQIDPKKGAEQLRSAAAFYATQSFENQPHAEVIVKQLRLLAQQMETKAQDHESMQQVLAQLQSLKQMYLAN